jgi:hypothetical protein
MELGQIRLRPADLRQPLAHSFLACRGQLVHLAVGVISNPSSVLARHQASLLQASELDIDMTRVNALAERTECPIQPNA